MGDDDATRDMFMVRAQQVRAAVAALGEALDGDATTQRSCHQRAHVDV